MADNSKIEWTEATWNPITGCSVVSPGCTNCYAMRLAGTRMKNHWSRNGLTVPSKGGPVWNGEVRFNEPWLCQPLKWKRPRAIFVCAHGDLFHENVPDAWIDQILAVTLLTPQHTYQVLTKRAERMYRYFNGPYPEGNGVFGRIVEATLALAPKRTDLPEDAPLSIIEVPVGPRLTSGDPEFGFRRFINPGRHPMGKGLSNVWLGVSAEDQTRADERIPWLLNTPAAVRWVSAEPLIGPIDFKRIYDSSNEHSIDALAGLRYHAPQDTGGSETKNIDWIVVGGESGNGARTMERAWADNIVRDCRAADVKVFVKQLGACYSDAENGVAGHSLAVDPDVADRVTARLKDTKGGNIAEFPASLQVREYPQGV